MMINGHSGHVQVFTKFTNREEFGKLKKNLDSRFRGNDEIGGPWWKPRGFKEHLKNPR